MQQKWIHYLWEKQFLQILTIGVRSTLLSSSNRNANTMQFSVLLNWCMALNEFIAGSAIIASIHCCGNPHCFSSEGHIPLNRSGLLLHPYEASSTRNKCICPTNSEVWFFFFFPLMCEAALQNSETVISDLTKTTEENWLLEISAYP